MSYPRNSTWGMQSDPAENWAARAACRTDPEAMFPHPQAATQIAHARAVCARCPVDVRAECLRDGIRKHDFTSVRGGYLGGEREQFARAGIALEAWPPPATAPKVQPACRRCHEAKHLQARGLCGRCVQATRRDGTYSNYAPISEQHAATAAARIPSSECGKGHKYTPANTYVSPAGMRSCRRCRADREAIYRKAKGAKR